MESTIRSTSQSIDHRDYQNNIRRESHGRQAGQPQSHIGNARSSANKLSRQIRFQNANGKVWFDEQRVLLLQLASLTNFRKEQIETVGLERAKGFFMRLGYSLGQKDAELARRLCRSGELAELIHTGFELHSLKGMVRVDEQKLDVGADGDDFYAEYILHDSYEAEMFTGELGLINEPVCWSLVGHASAFTSSILGREILFKETSCRGCGDSECRIVGRPAQQWEDAAQYRKYLDSSPIIEELYQLQSQISVLRHKIDAESTLGNFRGQSDGYQRVCHLANKAASGKVTVLLLGETGVGKELVAKGIHTASERKDNAFVAVNCAAIPPDLIESELFGVCKGAFTGASQTREGRFERAHNGTIFLDEVVELSPRAQATLLRVLQEGELERVGDSETRKIDVRVVAATNESLEIAVQEGRFRADLFYRLNVYPIHIPPLRERREDIPLLIEHFLQKYQAYYSKRVAGLSDMASEAMMNYAWPGNVRELENLIERGMILTDSGDAISANSLFPTLELGSSKVVSAQGLLVEEAADAAMAEADSWIEAALKECGSLDAIEERLVDYALGVGAGNVSSAARVLGISRPTFAYRMKKRAAAACSE
ncbi:sigma 54-interacting transcriptional regulator [Pseudomaricurvus alcaniphilus]|uniref:sigma-54-dependent Fis family transcriptional regulator n=1 Tax=Pseudomaricurvus alcaniphilus TaxID=1166482 RepID=UPI00140A1CC7|nr:sigma-54-dependent Fis family transcriptional regulator [Pseudomaricurvus alcaniphilus]NHN37524.1 sigma 54-interacting transcriptional regulator [Pseudomaricurvus alcaniphilus]